MQTDVIIVGAGAAGLMAAYELARAGKQVLVLEARNRIGGRAHTITDASFTQAVETGAEFVHGNLELTLHLLQKAGLQKATAGGAAWRSSNGHLFQQKAFIADADALMHALQMQKEETSVGDFLEAHFSSDEYGDLKKSVASYVNGYYAGELNRASVLALKEEWEQEEQPQYRVPRGYSTLLQFLYDESVAHGVLFQVAAPVKNIIWGFEKVVVTTKNAQQFEAQKIIVTLPVALLQNADEPLAISFQPALTQHSAAFKKLGYGSVIKIVIEFKTAFWIENFNLKNLSFLFSDEAIPTWWTQHPQPSSVLTGWCAGPHADALKHQTNAQLFQTAIQSLSRIFNLPVAEVENNSTAWKACNWAADPFTSGGYSYITTQTKEALQVLLQPVENTIYFAGEALYDNINVGTVEAALQSGKRTAQQVLLSFPQP